MGRSCTALVLFVVVSCGDDAVDNDPVAGQESGDTAAVVPADDGGDDGPQDECQEGGGNADCGEDLVCVGRYQDDWEKAYWTCKSHCANCAETYPSGPVPPADGTGWHEQVYWCDDDADCCFNELIGGEGTCNVATGQCVYAGGCNWW